MEVRKAADDGFLRAYSGNLRDKSVDTIPGISSCGVQISQPGVWYYFIGTGRRVRLSTCDSSAPNDVTRTQVKASISVFSGGCNSLVCEGGSSQSDYDCAFRQSSNPWITVATAYDMETERNKRYSVLVQGAAGDAYLTVREMNQPQNDFCDTAIGPIRRDRTRMDGISVDASLQTIPICGQGQQNLYPGVWYQVMGTGDDITVGACTVDNSNGYEITVYHAANCNNLQCANFERKTIAAENVPSEDCSYGANLVRRPMYAATFKSNDLDRYYVLVTSNAVTSAQGKPTSEFRFYVDDGKDGQGGSGGAASIEFRGTGGGGGGSNNDDGTNDSDDGSGGKKNIEPNGLAALSTIAVSILSIAFVLDVVRRQ